MARGADDYLGEQLVQIDRHPGPYQDAALRFARNALVAFRETGLVAPEESDAWDARLLRAAEDPLGRLRLPLPLEARAAAHRHLERLVADLAGDPRHELSAHMRFDGATRALVDIGAVTPDEAARWRERAFPPPPDVPALPHFDKTHMVRVTHGPAEAIDGLRVTLIELYTDAFSLLRSPSLRASSTAA